MIYVLGSLNIDLVVQVERFPQPGETLRGTRFDTFPGGKGGNQTMAVARLGGAPRMAARVGDDDFGTRYRTELIDAGVDTDRVVTVPRESTGTALIEVDASGQNHIVIVAGANGRWDAATVDQALGEITTGDILLLQLEVPYPAVWRAARIAADRGAQVILDPAPAPPADDPIPAEVYPCLAWITPNESEAAALTGINTDTDQGQRDAAAALAARGVTHAVVKAGARGAWLATGVDAPSGAPDAAPRLIPGFPVQAVDTTAAGDSFNGGLAYGLSRGASPEEAVRYANAVAAISVTAMGAQTAMPTSSVVEQFLTERR